MVVEVNVKNDKGESIGYKKKYFNNDFMGQLRLNFFNGNIISKTQTLITEK